MRKSRWVQFVLCLVFALVASTAEAATVTCTNPGDLQAAIGAAQPFEVITVSGTCTERFLTIGSNKNGLVLDGQNTAVIQDLQPPTVGATAITVTGATQVVIRNFANITSNPTDGTGVFIADGASARMLHNTISGNSAGVDVARNAQARILENTVTDNPDTGILVRETSSARIGLNFTGSFPGVTPNTIQLNGTGVRVSRGSSARIM